MKHLVTIAALCLATPSYAELNSEIIAKFVSKVPRNEWGAAIYWLEMKSAVGWKKMILVVGYAANGPICERLAAVARIDAPAREFRCNTAN